MQSPILRRVGEATPSGIPSLNNGDQLDQSEFHRRYQHMPEGIKAELVEGVVYMASPVHRLHGIYHLKMAMIFGLYECDTPGVEAADNWTAILGNKSEPQPDLNLRLFPEFGGQSRCDDDKCLIGAPELIGEIAHSSVSIDLGKKKSDYFQAGVQEYVVYCIEEREIHWFHFPSRRKLRPDRRGIWKSKVFPGFWLNGPAFIERDTAKLKATLLLGLASAEHARFVQVLRKRRKV